MDRPYHFMQGSFWAFSIITIILLAPSSGLITLTVPDEPYGNVAVLPDASHLNKRASDDSEHFAFDATFTIYDIHPTLFTLDEVVFTRRNNPYAALVSPDQIRAPPAMAVV